MTRVQRTELSKIEQTRLYPRLTNPNFLVLRARRLIFERWIKSVPGTSLRVLDIGGRYQPYRPLFGNRIKSYIACDILSTGLVDVVARGESLPVRGEHIRCSDLHAGFEYFGQPIEASAQVHRVLKPDGVFMSVAAFAPRFVDEECWRFTPGGIRTTLSQFSAVEIAPETSSIGGLLRASNLWLHWLVRFSWGQKSPRSYDLSLPDLACTGTRVRPSDEQRPVHG